MSYLDKNLLPSERILFRTKKHLIIFFYPLMLAFFSMYASIYMQSNPILTKLTWTPWLVTLLFWGHVWFEYAFSEFAVTNKRVMMREGFFYRHTTELRLSTIAQVNVDQSILGQLLNYGTIRLMSFGASDAYTLVANPFTFQRVVNEQVDTLTK